MLISVGTSAVPRAAISAIGRRSARCRARCSRCPAPIRAGQRVGAEDVRGDPGPRGVRGGDRRDQHVVGPQRGEVAAVAVDPVADQLDPAVAAAACSRTACGSSAGRRARRRGRDVALGPAEVPAGADDPRQVGAVVAAAGCRPAIRSRGSAACRRPGRSAPARAASARLDRRRRCRSRRGSARRPGPGSSQPPSADGLRAGHRLGGDHARRRTHRSPGSPSGSSTPAQVQRGRCRRHGSLALGNFSFDRSKPGRQLVQAGQPGQRRAGPAGSARAPGRAARRAARPALRGGVGPRLPLPFLPFFVPLRPRRFDMGPAAEAHAAGHLLHHLAGLEEPLHQLVDVADAHAGAVGDAQPPRRVDDLRSRPARPASSTRMIACDPVELAVVDLLELLLHLARAGQHARAGWRSGPSCGSPASARGSPPA